MTSGQDPLDRELRDAPFWRQGIWWRQTGVGSVGMWASTVLILVTALVVARGLGPREYGVVVLAISVTSLVGMLLDLTLDEAVVQLGLQEFTSRRFGQLRSLLRAALGVDVAIGVAVYGAIAATAGPLSDVVGGHVDPSLIRLAGLALLAATVDGTTTGALVIAGRPELRGWLMALTNAVRLGAVIVALSVGDASTVLIAYAVGAAVGAAVQGLVAWRVAWRGWRAAPAEGSAGAWVGPLVRFGVHTSLSVSVLGANRWLVPVLLGQFAGPVAVGVFSVALLPVNAVAALTAPLRLSLFPEQVKFAARGMYAQLRMTVTGYTRIALLLGVPGAVAAWFAVPSLITLLFTDNFSQAVTPTRIMILAALAQLAYGWSKTYPAAIGKPQIRTKMAVLELALTISLVVLLEANGADGGAWAVTCASLVLLGVWLGIGMREPEKGPSIPTPGSLPLAP